MRRLWIVLAAAVMMAAMLAVIATPAFAKGAEVRRIESGGWDYQTVYAPSGNELSISRGNNKDTYGSIEREIENHFANDSSQRTQLDKYNSAETPSGIHNEIWVDRSADGYYQVDQEIDHSFPDRGL